MPALITIPELFANLGLPWIFTNNHPPPSLTEKLPPNPPAAFAPIPVMQGSPDQRQPAHPSCAASCEAEMPWCITYKYVLIMNQNYRIYLHEVLKVTSVRHCMEQQQCLAKFHVSHPQMVEENICEVPCIILFSSAAVSGIPSNQYDILIHMFMNGIYVYTRYKCIYIYYKYMHTKSYIHHLNDHDSAHVPIAHLCKPARCCSSSQSKRASRRCASSNSDSLGKMKSSGCLREAIGGLYFLPRILVDFGTRMLHVQRIIEKSLKVLNSKMAKRERVELYKFISPVTSRHHRRSSFWFHQTDPLNGPDLQLLLPAWQVLSIAKSYNERYNPECSLALPSRNQ